jgi:hypothetical protein
MSLLDLRLTEEVRAVNEVDLSRAVWRKSRRSGNGNECVEVANLDHIVAVRDSKNPNGPKLALTSADWRALIARVRDGAFDL